MPEADTIAADSASDAAVSDSGAQAPDAGHVDSTPVVTSPGTDSPAKPGDAQSSADKGSLAADTDARSQPTDQKQPQVPAGYVPQKDLNNLKRELAIRQQELQRAQRQYEPYKDLDPATVAAFRKQQSEAQAAKLPLWNAKHPENGRFSELKARWQQANQSYSRLAHGKTPEEQEQIRSNVLADFSPDDQRVMREHSVHARRFSERMAEDPEGTLAELIEHRVGNMLAQREQQSQQRQSAEQSVGQWFNDQANSQVVESQRDWMVQNLENGVPWTIVRLEAENRHLRSQVGASNAKAMSAEERSRLAKSNASIARDPVTAPIDDPFEYAMRLAKERHVDVGGAGWSELVSEVTASLNLK